MILSQAVILKFGAHAEQGTCTLHIKLFQRRLKYVTIRFLLRVLYAEFHLHSTL